MALALFGVSAGVSGVNILTGREDCGCFGIVESDPRWVLLLDLAVVAALAATLRVPSLRQPSPSPRRCDWRCGARLEVRTTHPTQPALTLKVTKLSPRARAGSHP